MTDSPKNQQFSVLTQRPYFVSEFPLGYGWPGKNWSTPTDKALTKTFEIGISAAPQYHPALWGRSAFQILYQYLRNLAENTTIWVEKNPCLWCRNFHMGSTFLFLFTVIIQLKNLNTLKITLINFTYGEVGPRLRSRKRFSRISICPGETWQS